jgi:hypothetical protein
MYIPGQLVKESNFQNFLENNNNNKIFKNKIVSRKRSPLLYNIELGLEKIDIIIRGINTRQRTTQGESDRAILARTLLDSVNASRANLPKEHSLISKTAGNVIYENKSILNTAELEKIFNEKITAVDKFPINTDPFYKLDEGNISNYNYERETIDGEAVSMIDLSQIAAGLVSLNEVEQYSGKSKYFMNSEIIETLK